MQNPRPTFAVLSLVLASSLVGCAAPTDDDLAGDGEAVEESTGADDTKAPSTQRFNPLTGTGGGGSSGVCLPGSDPVCEGRAWDSIAFVGGSYGFCEPDLSKSWSWGTCVWMEAGCGGVLTGCTER